MFLGNRLSVPSIVDLPGQGGGNVPQPFQSTDKFLFDGNDGFLRSKIQNNYRFTDELTLSCWVTFGDSLFDFTQNQKNFMIIDQADNNFNNGYCLYVTRSPNNTSAFLRFSIGQGGAPTPQQRAQINITNLRTSKDQVFFILATFKDQNLQLFLKAVGVNSSNSKQAPSSTISYSQSQNFFCIGNTSPQANSEFDGNIDEVGIWNDYLNAGNATALFNWDTNGDLEKYSNGPAGLNLQGWYRMGENATYVPNTETYDVLAENNDFIITEDGISVVTQDFVENLGVWTVKSATDLSDTSKYLVSSKPGDDTIGFLPPTVKKQPGLPPPT